MLRNIYIVAGVVSAFSALLFFGYGIAHGATWLLLLFPVIIGVFLVPFYFQRRFHHKSWWVRASLVLPIVLVIFLVVYFYVFQPQQEKSAATYALENIIVEPISDEVVRTVSGEIIGIKIMYALTLPLGLEDALSLAEFGPYFSLPMPELVRSDGSPDGLLDIVGNLTHVSRDGVGQDPIGAHFPPGRYVITAVYLGKYVQLIDNNYCRSKNFEQFAFNDESFQKVENEALSYSLVSRVNLSHRMGTFYVTHLKGQPVQTLMPGEIIRKTIAMLPVCPRDY